MKLYLSLVFLLISFCGRSQTKLIWSKDYELKFEDFQSKETEINKDLNSSFISFGSSLEFNFAMTTY